MARIPTNTGGADIRDAATPRMVQPNAGPAIAAVSRAASRAGTGVPRPVQIPKAQSQALDLSPVTKGLFGLSGVVGKKAEARRKQESKLWYNDEFTKAAEGVEVFVDEESKNPVGLTERFREYKDKVIESVIGNAPSKEAAIAFKSSMDRLFLSKLPDTLTAEAVVGIFEREQKRENTISRDNADAYHNPAVSLEDKHKRLDETIAAGLAAGDFKPASRRHQSLKQEHTNFRISQIEGFLAAHAKSEEGAGEDYLAAAQKSLESYKDIKGPKRDELQRRIIRAAGDSDSTTVYDEARDLRNGAAMMFTGKMPQEPVPQEKLDALKAGDSPQLADAARQYENAQKVGKLIPVIQSAYPEELPGIAQELETTEEFASVDLQSKRYLTSAVEARLKEFEDDPALATEKTDFVGARKEAFDDAYMAYAEEPSPENLVRVQQTFAGLADAQRSVQGTQLNKHESDVRLLSNAMRERMAKQYSDADDVPKLLFQHRDMFGDNFTHVINEVAEVTGMHGLSGQAELAAVKAGEPFNMDVVEALFAGAAIDPKTLRSDDTGKLQKTQAEQFVGSHDWFANWSKSMHRKNPKDAPRRVSQVRKSLVNLARSKMEAGMDADEAIGGVLENMSESYYVSDDGRKMLYRFRRDGAGNASTAYTDKEMRTAIAMMDIWQRGVSPRHMVMMGVMAPDKTTDKLTPSSAGFSGYTVPEQFRRPRALKYVLDPEVMTMKGDQAADTAKARNADVIRTQTWWASDPSETSYTLVRDSATIGGREITTMRTKVNDFKGTSFTYTVDELNQMFDQLAVEVQAAVRK